MSKDWKIFLWALLYFFVFALSSLAGMHIRQERDKQEQSK